MRINLFDGSQQNNFELANGRHRRFIIRIRQCIDLEYQFWLTHAENAEAIAKH